MDWWPEGWWIDLDACASFPLQVVSRADTFLWFSFFPSSLPLFLSLSFSFSLFLSLSLSFFLALSLFSPPFFLFFFSNLAFLSVWSLVCGAHLFRWRLMPMIQPHGRPNLLYRPQPPIVLQRILACSCWPKAASSRDACIVACICERADARICRTYVRVHNSCVYTGFIRSQAPPRGLRHTPILAHYNAGHTSAMTAVITCLLVIMAGKWVMNIPHSCLTVAASFESHMLGRVPLDNTRWFMTARWRRKLFACGKMLRWFSFVVQNLMLCLGVVVLCSLSSGIYKGGFVSTMCWLLSF